MTDENSWRTSGFRQSVTTKIHEEMRQFRKDINSHELENLIYEKAENKEEYLAYIAKLVLHTRKMRLLNSGRESIETIIDKVMNSKPPRLVKVLPLSEVSKILGEAENHVHESLCDILDDD